MWIPVFLLVVFIIWLLVYLWPFVLAGLIIWMFVFFMSRDPKPVRPPKAVKSKAVKALPALKPAQPWPIQSPPEPSYLPRWTPTRRMHAERERALWQKGFEAAGRDAEGAGFAPRMTKP